MTKTTVTVTPRCDDEFVELSQSNDGSGLFLKKVLPKGSISYKGRKVTFNDTFLNNIVNSFQAGAYDQTSFCLANEKNDHKVKPTDWAGEVKGLEVRDDGLYATMELANEAAKLVRGNKKLGVSCGIKVGYTREADGKAFPAALHHVLGTLDPKVTGLGEWEELKLANEDEVLTDLSGEQWLVTSTPVRKEPSQQAIADALLAIELANQIVLEEEGGDGKVTKPDVQLSNTAETERISALELELAETRFEKLQAEWIDAGVPPALITLAEPLLKTPRVEVIELANGEDSIDPVALVKGILDECKGFIKLSNEQGNTFDGKTQEASYVDQQLSDWKVG